MHAQTADITREFYAFFEKETFFLYRNIVFVVLRGMAYSHFGHL